jgi:hypothetical protein
MQEDSGPRLAQAKAWPYLKKKKLKQKGLRDHLPSKQKVLNSNHSTSRKKKRKQCE